MEDLRSSTLRIEVARVQLAVEPQSRRKAARKLLARTVNSHQGDGSYATRFAMKSQDFKDRLQLVLGEVSNIRNLKTSLGLNNPAMQQLPTTHVLTGRKRNTKQLDFAQWNACESAKQSRNLDGKLEIAPDNRDVSLRALAKDFSSDPVGIYQNGNDRPQIVENADLTKTRMLKVVMIGVPIKNSWELGEFRGMLASRVIPKKSSSTAHHPFVYSRYKFTPRKKVYSRSRDLETLRRSWVATCFDDMISPSIERDDICSTEI